MNAHLHLRMEIELSTFNKKKRYNKAATKAETRRFVMRVAEKLEPPTGYKEIVFAPSKGYFWWVRPGEFVRGPFRTIEDTVAVRDFKAYLDDVRIKFDDTERAQW